MANLKGEDFHNFKEIIDYSGSIAAVPITGVPITAIPTIAVPITAIPMLWEW
jgi:hypothetical protein